LKTGKFKHGPGRIGDVVDGWSEAQCTDILATGMPAPLGFRILLTALALDTWTFGLVRPW
jgi:hypothetical protein